MIRNARASWPALLLCAAVLGPGCERETRRYQELPAGATRAEGVRQSALQPGEPHAMSAVLGPYDENAWGISEGKRLYSAYNCVGCHAYGGGGIGPPLMDDKWIYGAAPQQIYSTIVEGRTNGMPAYGGRVPDQQVWQLVAYVQSMSGLTPQDAAAGRDDNLAVKEPEVRKERERPKQTGHR
jgi:cytochrome c oxidase cbb3-type subunit 3